MDHASSCAGDHAQSLYLPHTDIAGRECVLITRPGEAQIALPFSSKEEACYWARRWVRKDRLKRMEENVFGSAWLGSTNQSYT
jgi:hypothetical protein